MSGWFSESDLDKAKVIAKALLKCQEEQEKWESWIKTLPEPQKSKEIAKRSKK